MAIHRTVYIQRGFYILEVQLAEDVEIRWAPSRGYINIGVRETVQSVLLGYEYELMKGGYLFQGHENKWRISLPGYEYEGTISLPWV